METVQSKNGVAKKPATKKTTPVVKKAAPKNAVIELANENLKKMVTFQQTVDRVNEIKKLMDDYTKVSETLKSISEFKGISGESVQFNLQDFTNDNQFMTYNTNLISIVVDILTEKLEAKQAELVDKILNFEI